MFGTFDFCLPTRGIKVPDRPEWIHEVKYDGYRLRVELAGERVRLITRGGYDWTKRYPWIIESALKNRHQQFVIDGQAFSLSCLHPVKDLWLLRRNRIESAISELSNGTAIDVPRGTNAATPAAALSGL
jgi:ATP-dependent DNA ligase